MSPARLIGSFAPLLLVGSASAYVHFESAPVHPVELSPDGSRLFVVNTADHRVAVFDVTAPGAPVRVAEIPVGLEPVTVRARSSQEIWVANHVSDDVSVVDVGTENVVATILAGDEPTDVVFAGTPQRAFVCVSQEDRVRVYDPDDLSATPVTIGLAGADPRSLALSPDGSTLYVGIFSSGHATTTVLFDSLEVVGGPPPPSIPMNPDLPPPPITGLIVKHDGTHWVDETGASWDWAVPYRVYDNDVIAVDVASAAVTGSFTGVGTNLFNVAVNPATGVLVVTNQEALSEVRFEPVLRGQFIRNRVTLIDPASGIVTPVHLNQHINYGDPAGNPVERSLSLSVPTDVVVSSDGQTIYVAALGSRKVAVLDASGAVTRRIAVGDGPCGLALDESGNRLFVLNRHDGTVSVVDLGDDSSVAVPLGFDPTPTNIREGRSLFYDGENSSAHGDASCASCHVFGGVDDLAWDLGDPSGVFQPPPEGALDDSLSGFHPMKGPMITQPLKALTGTEPLHWRGDKAVLSEFNGAFVSLNGRSTPLPGSELQRFEDFVFSMQYGANPNRNLDGTLPASFANGNPVAGQQAFVTPVVDGGAGCIGCHVNPSGNNPEVLARIRVQLLTNQDMTVPQLRTMYEKTRFRPDAPFTVRSYGTTHAGTYGDIQPHDGTLQQGGPNGAPADLLPRLLRGPNEDKTDMTAFLLCFDTGTHPAVGAQWTMDGTNEPDGIDRVNTLVSVADAGSVGLIAKGREPSGEVRGWTYQGVDSWIPDRYAEPATTLSSLLALAGDGTEITFTGVLKGTEIRLGIDRDDDGYRDRDELDWGSDPGDPGSTPSAVFAPAQAAAGGPEPIRSLGRNPTSTTGRFALFLDRRGPAQLKVYDVQGRLVRTLVDDAERPAGSFEATWDLRDGAGRHVGNGVYFVRFSRPEGSAVRRLTVVR